MRPGKRSGRQSPRGSGLYSFSTFDAGELPSPTHLAAEANLFDVDPGPMTAQLSPSRRGFADGKNVELQPDLTSGPDPRSNHRLRGERRQRPAAVFRSPSRTPALATSSLPPPKTRREMVIRKLLRYGGGRRKSTLQPAFTVSIHVLCPGCTTVTMTARRPGRVPRPVGTQRVRCGRGGRGGA